MKFIKNIASAFKRKSGVFVSIKLDREFGEIKAGQKDAVTGPFERTLFIPDISIKEVDEKIKGRGLNWHIIPLVWRHNLEIKKFHSAKWADVKSLLSGF